MNEIEKIALQKLKEHLCKAKDRCHEVNKDRMQHERTFLASDINNALKVVQALEENNEK